jgi:hypothetical protein
MFIYQKHNIKTAITPKVNFPVGRGRLFVRYLLLAVVVFCCMFSFLVFSNLATFSAGSVLKTPIRGLFDRGSLGGSSYSVPTGSGVAALNGVVANVSWADLQTTPGGPIVHPNQLDSALSAVASYNASHTNQLEVKLRIFAGIYAPNWAKTIDGWNPANANTCNNQGSPCGTLGPFWTTDYDNAYKTFMTELAAAYDNQPLLHDVTISQCMTTFAEPFMRDDTNLGAILYDTSSQPAYTGLPYSVQADENCLMDEIDDSTAFQQTNLSLSFNPFKPWTNATTQSNSPGESFTLSVMQHCRAVLGSQCTIENNSIRDSYVGQQDQSGNLYNDITNEGPDITFQTAAPNAVGSIVTTVQWAAQMGANAVELPSNYNTLTVSQLDSLSADLMNNPTNPSSPPPPTCTASPTINLTAPTSGATVSGSSVSLAASAAPAANCTLSKVVFSINNSAVATVTSAPYVATWDSTTISNGPQTLTATVTDLSGHTASKSIGITVSNNTQSSGGSSPGSGGTHGGDSSSSSPPVTVSGGGTIQAVPGTTTKVAGNITLAPSLVIPNSTITSSTSNQDEVIKVAYYLNSQLLGVETKTPFQYHLNTTNYVNGTYALKTVTYYASGKVTSSSQKLIITNPFSLKQFGLVALSNSLPIGLILVIVLGCGVLYYWVQYLAPAGRVALVVKAIISRIIDLFHRSSPPTDLPQSPDNYQTLVPPDNQQPGQIIKPE